LPFALLALLLAAVCLLAGGCAGSKSVYEQAEQLFGEGQYAEALELYRKIPDYGDASQKGEECEKEIADEKAYGDALALMGAGQYGDALEAFGELGGYRDSRDKKKECEDYDAYNAALSAMEQGRLETALADFAALGAFLDSAELAESCEAEIEDRKWEIAVNGDIAESYGQYISEYPDGKYLAEANSQIAAALSRKEDQKWAAAMNGDTAESYGQYISEYPDGKYLAEASSRIEVALFREQEADFGAASQENTILALREFAEKWPDSPLRPQAEEQEAALRDDSGVSRPLLDNPNEASEEAVEAFLRDYPGHSDEEQVRALLTRNNGDLQDLMAAGAVAAEVTGESITATQLRLENLTQMTAQITIPLGTYFSADSRSVQNMVAREEVTIALAGGASRNISVKTACMNIERSIPDDSNGFSVARLDADSKLARLMKVLEENGCSYTETQAAVWLVNNAPGDFALLNTLIYSDGTSAISPEDLETAKEMAALAN
jgi:outer membrane protein assembly factor BamD (BamD/ComL family)